MTYHFKQPSVSVIKTYLQDAKTIAVVGLSDRQDTAAYRVSRFMQEKGYRLIPVNPKLAGQDILGERVYASLLDILEPVDIVNVFRRSEFLIDVARDFVKTNSRVFWAQLGLESQEAETFLKAAGCSDIVMNRCIKIDYQNLLEDGARE